jgi:capsular exopolysaccharide synthesis family protein
MTAEQLASVDPTMAHLLGEKQSAQDRLDNATQVQNFGANHPVVLALKQELELADSRIADREAFLKANLHSLPQPGGETPGSSASPLLSNGVPLVTQATVDAQRALTEHLKAEVKSIESKLEDMNTQREAINEVKSRIDSLKDAVAYFNSQYDQLNNALFLNGQSGVVEVLSHGDLPMQPTVDKRKQFAAIGFVAGAVISLAIFSILGLMDSRYRYCDEAGTEMSGASLLGILPNLPDLLSDPEQAAIAAHCVHQIRTLLQISGNSYGRNVFAITSAAAGDGKTSLSLALGLSFAASGSRTLLIDCDLVGAGLTARMNVRSEQGVLEAMAGRNIEDFIRETDVNNLWILPVGEALGSFAGTVSPAAVRRLVEQARKLYEVVLIDTGPVLGSIEASPVAVAADAVVLCVSRGQHKPIVDKTMLHLASIGCKLAGVVFNRAQSQDFERSVSRMALPSIPATANGHGKRREASVSGNAFGPVARAVASSVKPPAGSESN